MKHFHVTLKALQRLRREGMPVRDWLSAVPAATIASATLAMQESSSTTPDDNSHLQPVFVLGHWRSGTTWLHEMLALNPIFSTPNVYECLYPHHFALTEASLGRSRGLNRAQARPMDGMPVLLDSPQEDEFALMSLGAVSMYRWMILPSRFEVCLGDLDPSKWTAADLDHWIATFRSFLERVRAQRPGRLLLKSPTHQFRVPLLRQIFPEARFVHLVRDPRSVYLSSIKLWQDMFSLHALEPFNTLNLGECVLRIGEAQERLALPTIGKLPPNICHRLSYEELAAEPLQALESLHRALKLPWETEQVARVEQYLRERQGHRATSGREPIPATLEAVLRQRWPLAFTVSHNARP